MREPENPVCTESGKIAAEKPILSVCLPGIPNSQDWLNGWDRLLLHLVQNFRVSIHRGTGTYIHNLRTELLEGCFEDGIQPDYILWIDSDNPPSAAGFDTLLESLQQRPEISGIGAWYLMHGPRPAPVVAKRLGSDDWMQVSDLMAGHPLYSPIEVSEIGFGFILIRGQVFRDLAPAPFAIQAGSVPGTVKGEDVAFCHLAREKGHRIFLHPKVHVPHMKLQAVAVPPPVEKDNPPHGPEGSGDDGSAKPVLARPLPRRAHSSNADILVVCGAWDKPERWALLKESAARHDVPLHVLGNPAGPYPGMDSLQPEIDFLKQRKENYIVCTDAFDVLVNRWDAQEVKLLIDQAPDLIMSVESWVWPNGAYAAAYAGLPERYPWYAINGGQYCGRREQLIGMLECMLGRYRKGDAQKGGSSQEILHQMFAESISNAGSKTLIHPIRLFPFTLDLECRIFQSMFGPPAGLIECHRDTSLEGTEYIDPRAFNTVHKTFPMFLHFNGKAPGLRTWADQLRPREVLA